MNGRAGYLNDDLKTFEELVQERGRFEIWIAIEARHLRETSRTITADELELVLEEFRTLPPRDRLP